MARRARATPIASSDRPVSTPRGAGRSLRAIGRKPRLGGQAGLDYRRPPSGYIAHDVMTRRGAEVQQLWESLITTPLYEELTVWVMAAWPDQMLEQVDTMVRTAIASADRVRQGEWTTERLIGVVRKAGRRGEHRVVHQHLGQEVHIVSFDDALVELAEDRASRGTHVSSLGLAIVSNLRAGLGEHRYMVTPSAAELLDRSCDIAVDHLDSVRARTVSAERPEGLSGLDLFAAARPTRRANKSNRITEVFRDLPHPTGGLARPPPLGYRPPPRGGTAVAPRRRACRQPRCRPRS